MSNPIWKLVKNPMTGKEDIVWRQWPNGAQESCTITDQQYLAWVSQGNEPLPAEEQA